MIWSDYTQYQRGDKDRTPRIWKTHFGRFVLSVHRHVDWPSDTWLASCNGVFDCRELVNKDIEKAKAEAVEKLQAIFETALREIKG